MSHEKGGAEEGPSIHRLLQTRGLVTIETEAARVVTLLRFTGELLIPVLNDLRTRMSIVDDKMARRDADSFFFFRTTLSEAPDYA